MKNLYLYKFSLSLVNVAAIIAAVGLMYSASHNFDLREVRPGQVWRYEIGNPFEKKIYDFKVMDVKDGYVLYRNVRYLEDGPGYDHVSRALIFKLGAELLTEEKI